MKRQEDEEEGGARPSFRLPAPSNPARTAQRKFRSPERRKAPLRVSAVAMPGCRTPQPGGQLRRRAGGAHGSAASAVERAGGRASGEQVVHVFWVQGENLSTLIFALDVVKNHATSPKFTTCFWSKHASAVQRERKFNMSHSKKSWIILHNTV